MIFLVICRNINFIAQYYAVSKAWYSPLVPPVGIRHPDGQMFDVTLPDGEPELVPFSKQYEPANAAQ